MREAGITGDRSYQRAVSEQRRRSGHAHPPVIPAAPDARLILSLLLNLLITLLQVAGGFLANSLGLLSDAAHNLSDVVALGLSLWAVRLGRRPATPSHTFAYKRAEVLVALFNSTVLVAISIYLIVEAVRRLLEPVEVNGLWVMGFAAGGLAINGLAAFLLRAHGRDLNLRSAFLHLLGDAATSFGVLVSGVVVYLWSWVYADAVISVVVSLWIAREAIEIVRRAVNVLLEGTPETIEFAAVKQAILTMPGIRGVHDLHVWSLSSAELALSAHVVVADTVLSELGSIMTDLKKMLANDFGIGHATLELETEGGECAGSRCAILGEGQADSR